MKSQLSLTDIKCNAICPKKSNKWMKNEKTVVKHDKNKESWN